VAPAPVTTSCVLAESMRTFINAGETFDSLHSFLKILKPHISKIWIFLEFPREIPHAAVRKRSCRPGLARCGGGL
jgi:hypothetical protein